MFKRPMLKNFVKRSVLVIVFSCLIGLAACGSVSGSSGGSNSTPTTVSSPTPPTATTAPSPASFKVTSIAMAVNPTSIAGMACGSALTVTYTATFHVAPNSPGGTVQFLSTTNNGRSSTSASLTFSPGETTKISTFTWSGTLEADNVYPGLGGVETSSPNQVISPTVKPTGTCTSTAAFKVTSIDLSVSPNTIAGKACNTAITFTYTVTFHIAPNSQGGPIQFTWTVNNGRSQTKASVNAGPGETTASYTFTSTGTLYPDHTFPGVGIVLTSSPDRVESPQVIPAGACE